MTQENDPTALKRESRLKSAKFLKSETLLQGEDEIIIVHGEVEYKLRRTSQDKLILTK
tara:strand:+ start:44 stop:217 length:174 start_codon:yes stop_codon:yes gene_type:complete